MIRPLPHRFLSLRQTTLAGAVIVLATALFTSTASAQIGFSSRSGGGAQQLVPAGYSNRTDKKGNSWSFAQNGVLQRTGNGMLNQGLILRVNGQNFYNYQPMMTADGKEYVLAHSHPQQMMGLQVTRRIRLYENEGVMRYLEVFDNPGGHDVTASVEIRSDFSGRYQSYISDDGNQDTTAMNARESSFLVMPSGSSHPKAYLFSVCSPKSAFKPTISNRNKYSLAFHYNITVPAGQTLCLLHTVSQVPTPPKTDSQTVAKTLKPVAIHRFVKLLPPEYRGIVENYSSGAGFGGIDLLSSTSIAALGVERGKQDVLALGEKTRLLGKASCGSLKFATSYGDIDIPFESVAALVGGNRGRSEMARVFLRDGQVFSGKATAEELRFVLPSGSSMNLEVASLDRLVRSELENEGKWKPETVALLETHRGDRLALTDAASVRLRCVTPWGETEFPLDDVLWIAPPEEEPLGHFIEFKDGSRLFGFLAGGTIGVSSQLFGEYDVTPQEIRVVITKSMLTRRQREEKEGFYEGEAPIQQPHLNLAGGQRIVGQVAAPTLNLITNAELLETTPEEIRLMENIAEEVQSDIEDTPPFRIETWGGSIVFGHVRERVIPVLVRGREWRVPLQDIVSIVYPQPRISDAARTNIARSIRDLGAEDWRTREAASEELREYGYLAKTLLAEALQMSGDAEVRRRLEQLLEGIE